METNPTKPTLILVAFGILPNNGSEPGKGYIWASALSRFYHLEVLTVANHAEVVEKIPLAQSCRIHRVVAPPDPSKITGLEFYRFYQRWCEKALPVCEQIIRERPVVGLHHVTLGSFRAMPRYDRLGIPYTIGPLGGGEYTPWALLPQLRLPPKEILVELARLPINAAFVPVPSLRATFAKARLTLATTGETAGMLKRMGARRVEVVFPDAIDVVGDDEAVLRRREQQAETLRGQFRCVCASRALWWKGIHLAIEFIALLRRRGINASLDVFAWGDALPAMRERAVRAGVEAHIHFRGGVSRDELMKTYEDCHLFMNPTLHDSASSALLEAYATGLPSMTLGLGGAATVTSPATGFNARVRRVDQWLEDGARLVAEWTADPQKWVEVCRAAKAQTHHYGFDHIERKVQQLLNPIFLSGAENAI